MIRFARCDRESVGEGHHRSGWPFVLQRLKRLSEVQITSDVLFDDFIERSFSYDPIDAPYSENWGGIMHHPPVMPAIANDNEKWENIFAGDMWSVSSGKMKFAIFTTEHQERCFSEKYPGIPTLVALHPTETEVPMWSPDAYLASSPKKIIQIGSYLRDTRAIYRVPQFSDFQKIRLFPGIKWLRKFDRAIAKQQARSGAKYYNPVTSMRRVDNHRYDWMLSNSIVMSVPICASACNVIVECIARCTPVITPRLDSIVEYLGEDYPLYVTDRTLVNRERMRYVLDRTVFDAYDYLRCMNKEFLNVDNYVNSIAEFISSVMEKPRVS